MLNRKLDKLYETVHRGAGIVENVYKAFPLIFSEMTNFVGMRQDVSSLTLLSAWQVPLFLHPTDVAIKVKSAHEQAKHRRQLTAPEGRVKLEYAIKLEF